MSNQKIKITPVTKSSYDGERFSNACGYDEAGVWEGYHKSLISWFFKKKK